MKLSKVSKSSLGGNMTTLLNNLVRFSLAFYMILLFCFELDAQQNQVTLLTSQLHDTLRYEGNYENSDLSVYDEAGYNRTYRINTPLGQFKSYNLELPPVSGKIQSCPSCALNETYKFHIGGFKRRDMFSPDEIGKIFSENNIDYTDGPGNGLFESLMICKKYGIKHFFYAPDFYDLLSSSGWSISAPKMKNLSSEDTLTASAPSSMESISVTNHELDLPFLNTDTAEYKKKFKEELLYMKARSHDFSEIFPQTGGLFEKDYYNDPDELWLLFVGGDMTPIDLFWQAARKNYKAVNEEFKSEHGFNLPLMLKPETPIEIAHRIIFWKWVRRKFTDVMKLRAEVFRKVISGRGILSSNVHFDTQIDYSIYGSTFDYPGFAIRPQMTDSKLMWKYLMGYGTRLTSDLCKKSPTISVRTNLAAAGSRIVPTSNTIEYWYSQAIQNGCSGFYLWEQDYPSYKGAYSGPNIGNPDSSSLPNERWKTHLAMAKELGATKIFIPPKPETAVLVSLDACSLGSHGWKRVFSSYVELTKAKVWINFISDEQIKEGIDSLSEYKVVYVPYMNYEDQEVVEKIIKYVKDGGTVISDDPKIFSYNLEGKSLVEYRNELFGVSNISKKQTWSKIKLVESFGNIPVRPYSNSQYELSPNKKVEVAGKYDDGNPALIINHFGKGQAILWGSPIFDIYLYSNRTQFEEDSTRYIFFRKIASLFGTKDLSWIWNVNVKDIQKVTGTIPQVKNAPLQSIKFRRYLR